MARAGIRADAPTRAGFETVHASDHTRVTRFALAGRALVRKEPLGPDAHARLWHEVAMLERLDGVVGVAQLVHEPKYSASIVMEDAGRANVAHLAKPLAADGLIELAVQLTRAVAAMHGRGVMHRDIAPANIVLAGDGAPTLVDFALASSLSGVRPEFEHHSEIVGTMPYLAPEQTGRTGRLVDQRADLYALGATLYELATGEPPFGSGDPLRLTHDHLARVPPAPAEVHQAIPATLSGIIMHLLEKEPDARYQSAEGLLHDLERLQDAPSRPRRPSVRIGEHDFPSRLLPPSRLVGRDDELATLGASFERALTGRCRGVLVAGAPGVGKTALVNELRPAVTGRDGWFVAGKFDQYRRDLEFDGVFQAFQALTRLLLAEPEDELAEIRARMVRALGPNAGLSAAVSPELGALLGVPPDPGDPLTAQVRAQRASVDTLRAVASRRRPVVFFVDDLQWAGRTPLGLFDFVLGEEPIEGLLLVGAYREQDLDAAHPLAELLARLPEGAAEHLRLGNLAGSHLATLVAGTLHADRATAAPLADAIRPHTSGNPYETVEMLNALRRDGVLTASRGGWRWDGAAVRDTLGHADAADFSEARIAALPQPSLETIDAMACLGGRAELRVLGIATGESPSIVEERLAPALDDGLLVQEPSAHDAVRFSHDRIHEAIVTRLEPPRRRELQLAMARRLASEPDLFAVAAEQYLPVVGELDEAAERRRAAGLLRRAADQAALIGDDRLANSLLAAAVELIDPGEVATRIEVHTARHAALYGLARLEEADQEYLAIERLAATALQRADVAAVQVRSLTHRNRIPEALRLGSDSLRELGIDVPADRSSADLDAQFDHLYRWLDDADDVERAEITDPALLAATRVINALLPAAYSAAELGMVAWLGLEAVRIWLEHGPGSTLIGPASHAAFATVALRGDYAAGYRAHRRILELGEARGYEPGTSQARFVFALQSCWFEPIESCVQAARHARNGLMAGGDMANTGYTYHATVEGLLDCAPSLDDFLAEVDSGLAFMRRTASEEIGQWLDSYRWLAGVMRGDASTGAGEPAPVDRFADNPAVLFHALITRAIAATILDDPDGVSRHAAAAMPLLGAFKSLYPTTWVYLLRGLALAGQARAADGDQRAALLSELDGVTRWMAERAADAPDNFLHLLYLLEAEQAWTTGDFRSALLAFDAARREVSQRQRPWHRALITERSARFRLAHGLDHDGYELLAQARREYLEWGAAAKVDQIDWAYPALQPQPDATANRRDDGTGRRSTVTTGTIDLLGILSASRALSSETSIERLHARVVEVLSNMTGATGVHLVLWSDDRECWLVPDPDSDSGLVPVGEDGDENALPLSVLRYLQRTREPLLLGDAASDDRFARDPYYVALGACSLLGVPILAGGTLGAVLLLENRLVRGAFTSERLESVKLIAGQLAVSLHNAQVNAEYRRMADEQAALRRVATLVAQGASPTAVFDAVAGEIERVLEADGVVLARYETSQEVTVVAHRGARALRLPPGMRVRFERRDDESTARLVDAFGMRVSTGAPIVVDGRPWGVAVAEWRSEESRPAEGEERMAQFARLLETAIANAHSRDQLTASRARLLTEADTARRRVARDLHDGAQQRLIHTVLTLGLAQRAHELGDGDAQALIAEAMEYSRRANEELRELAHGILPAALSHGGFRGGVDAIVERLDLAVNVDMPAERFPAEIEASAYFIVAEALTNIVKHAHAESAEVSASIDDGTLRVEVRDDGVGGADPRGRGLVGISDRASALGGQLRVESPAGGGTVVTATLPLSQDRAESI